MGTVYRARIVRTARPVAIKVLRADVVGVEQYESRFEAEALMTARIHHENVIELIEHGYLKDGRPYLVLELLTGRSLGEMLLTSEHFKWRRALAIIREAALGLEAVHAQEIVHRDLKPENIFLLPKRGGETVKIMDFGLAKSLGTHDEEMDLTQPGFAIGTPTYMAPERVTGDYDCRSDLYGLMVVAYQLLTGEPPFAGQGTEVLREHLSTQARALSETNGELEFPASVERLLAKALAKNVDARHQSASELVRDIDSVLRDETAILPSQVAPPKAAPKTTAKRAAQAPVRARPRSPLGTNKALMAGVVAVGAIALALIVSSAGSDSSQVAKARAAAGSAAPEPKATSEQAPAKSAAALEAEARDASELSKLDDMLKAAGYLIDAHDGDPLPGASACHRGRSSILQARACLFATESAAHEARSAAQAPHAATSVAIAKGRTLLWIVDESGRDLEGRNIQSLIEAFTIAE